MTGTVKKADAVRKFGFIKGEDGTEYFFHVSAVNGFWEDLLEDLSRGYKVEVTFDTEASPKGPRANNINRVDEGRGV